MKLIRKLIATWPAAAVLCAVIALALAATVSAAGLHRSQQTNSSAPPQAATVETLAPEAATPSAQCTAARQAVTTALGKDASEDATEKAASKKAGPAATEPNENKTESAALKLLRDAVRTACAGQPATPPTAACLAATKAIKDAQAADKTKDASEKAAGTEKSASDTSEDKAEKDALKTLESTKRAACGK